MTDQQRRKVVIYKAIFGLSFLVMIFMFRYAPNKMGLIGLFLLLGMFFAMAAALADEEVRKIPILSPRLLDVLGYSACYILLTIAMDHFGIKTKETIVLFQNNVFFIVFILLMILGMIRTVVWGK